MFPEEIFELEQEAARKAKEVADALRKKVTT
jgi:hypothetical protein